MFQLNDTQVLISIFGTSFVIMDYAHSQMSLNHDAEYCFSQVQPGKFHRSVHLLIGDPIVHGGQACAIDTAARFGARHQQRANH